MTRDYHELLDAGNAAQMEKLRANEHKGSLDTMKPEVALGLILDKWAELRIEIRRENVPEVMRLEGIRGKAAGIANFAHMIILSCDKAAR